MVKPVVYIDGEAGTTGLQIANRLAERSDLDVVSIDPVKRKDARERARLMNSADAVILCLPDDAAQEAVKLITNDNTVLIDASSAHRVTPGWTYGFPELNPAQREKIASSKRISNPGCYPTAAIALVAPLVRAGVIPQDYPLSVNAVSGYSGGGKALIAEFEHGGPGVFRTYGLTLCHKHVPEMCAYTGLCRPPIFSPSVGAFAQGMLVEVPLALWALAKEVTSADMRALLTAAYEGEAFVEVVSTGATNAIQKKRAGAAGHVPELDPESMRGGNTLRLFVFGNDEAGQARLVALLDNLGKGASGAAVQNLNIALGLDEGSGLSRLPPLLA